MSIVYLNNFINDTCNYSGGGDSKYYINLIIDEIIPFLDTAGISYVRVCSKNFQNTFNIKKCDLYLSLTSGSKCGLINSDTKKENINIFYVEGNCESKRIAEVIKNNMQKLCQNELKCITAKMCPVSCNICKDIPSTLIHLGNHSTLHKSKWLRENIENIALYIVLSIFEFFAIPFCGIQKSKKCKCKCKAPVMSRPNLNSQIKTTISETNDIKILGQWEDWYIISYENGSGYIQSKYILL